MALIKKRVYGAITLLNIEADKVESWDVFGATHIRVSMPVSLDNMLQMQEKGFQLVDRMIDVTIPLSRMRMDCDKLVRQKPVLISDRKDEIMRIAQASFPNDRRFQVSVHYNQGVANSILSNWIDEIETFYVCTYKEQVIGFLVLKESEDGTSGFIHLAAVDEKYRMTGAAMSLYANAILEGKRLGYSRIEGRISSSNMAVMNLYSFLGGTFSNPTDIYLKEVKR